MTDFNRPLWQVMDDSYGTHLTKEESYGAMLRAVADWLVPEEEQPGIDKPFVAWRIRKTIREQLLDEADRAEAAAVYEQARKRNHMRKNRGITTDS